MLEADLRPNSDCFWIYDGQKNQALILSRQDAAGRLSLRYLPIANLTEDANVEHVILTKTRRPVGVALRERLGERIAAPQFHRVALSVVKPDGLNPLVPL